MARIALGSVSLTNARMIERALRADTRLLWYADLLAADIAEAEAMRLPPWRKVTGHGRGLHSYEELECGHLYHLRHSKNWLEDHATKRRCQQCLREAMRAEGLSGDAA